MDKIHISGISCQAHVGVRPEERETAQEILVDLLLFLDLEAPAHTDEVEHTVDYEQIVENVQRTVREGRFRLLESLAGRLCSILLTDSQLESVQVTVRKFPESLREKVAYVAVEMRRERGVRP